MRSLVGSPSCSNAYDRCVNASRSISVSKVTPRCFDKWLIVSSAAHEGWGVEFAERVTLDVCDSAAFVFPEQWSAGRGGYDMYLVWHTGGEFTLPYAHPPL